MERKSPNERGQQGRGNGLKIEEFEVRDNRSNKLTPGLVFIKKREHERTHDEKKPCKFPYWETTRHDWLDIREQRRGESATQIKTRRSRTTDTTRGTDNVPAHGLSFDPSGNRLRTVLLQAPNRKNNKTIRKEPIKRTSRASKTRRGHTHVTRKPPNMQLLKIWDHDGENEKASP